MKSLDSHDLTLVVDNDWEFEIAQLFQDAYNLMAKKQRDYGSGNIEVFGEAGVIVRLSDKLARLRNLMQRGGEPETTDSLEDTWIDLANYGIIGLALVRGVAFHPQKRYKIVEVTDV